jgi:hypothetical protein
MTTRSPLPWIFGALLGWGALSALAARKRRPRTHLLELSDYSLRGRSWILRRCSDGVAFKVFEPNPSMIRALIQQLALSPETAEAEARERPQLQPLIWAIRTIGPDHLLRRLEAGAWLIFLSEEEQVGAGRYVALLQPGRDLEQILEYEPGSLTEEDASFLVRGLG